MDEDQVPLTHEDKEFLSLNRHRVSDNAIAENITKDGNKNEVIETIYRFLKNDPRFYAKIVQDECIGIRNLIIYVFIDYLFDKRDLKTKALEIRDALEDLGFSVTSSLGIIDAKIWSERISFRCSSTHYKKGEINV